jgi:ubiquinone/menaquinone biosynthesis C-methylase UbiE
MEKTCTNPYPADRAQPEAGPMQSYNRHVMGEESLSRSMLLPSCYRAPGSVDAWRHSRMLANVLPLTTSFPNAKWLTIGDGKFGSDAYVLKQYVPDVTATSISAHTLETASSLGFISSYAAANAESLSYSDNSFDFVLCKEALHHFPRPAIGFYEMFRVARTALVLIEPIEGPWRPLNTMKWMIKRTLRHDVTEQFEPSGNFIYRVSIREVTKMLMSLDKPCLAWRGINDFYYPPFAESPAGRKSMPALGTYFAIWFQNALASLKLLNYGLAILVCFKVRPHDELVGALRSHGFSVAMLPHNPFITSSPWTASDAARH